MKSFNEFWSTISAEELAHMAEIAGERSENIQTKVPEQILGTKIGVINTMITVQLLNRYHDWLAEQLDPPLDNRS